MPSPTRSPHALHDHTLDLLCRHWTIQDRRRLASQRAHRHLPRSAARHATIWQTIQQELRADRTSTSAAA